MPGFDQDALLRMLGQTAPSLYRQGEMPNAGLGQSGPSPSGGLASAGGYSSVTGQTPSGDLMVQQAPQQLGSGVQASAANNNPDWLHKLLGGLLGGLAGGGAGQNSQSNGAPGASGAGQGGIGGVLAQILHGAMQGAGGQQQSGQMGGGGPQGQNSTSGPGGSQFPWWLFLNRPQ